MKWKVDLHKCGSHFCILKMNRFTSTQQKQHERDYILQMQSDTKTLISNKTKIKGFVQPASLRTSFQL